MSFAIWIMQNKTDEILIQRSYLDQDQFHCRLKIRLMYLAYFRKVVRKFAEVCSAIENLICKTHYTWNLDIYFGAMITIRENVYFSLTTMVGGIATRRNLLMNETNLENHRIEVWTNLRCRGNVIFFAKLAEIIFFAKLTEIKLTQSMLRYKEKGLWDRDCNFYMNACSIGKTHRIEVSSKGIYSRLERSEEL